MTVTVLIKRKVTAGSETLLEELYREMTDLAISQKGYLGARVMKRVDVQGEYLIISQWEQIDDWSRWLISEGRRGFQERIDNLTGASTKFEIYE